MSDTQTKEDIINAGDLAESITYESAGLNWRQLQEDSVDLSLDQYKNVRRATDRTYSSVAVGYKWELTYTYMNPRASRKYGALKGVAEIVTAL